MFLNDQNLFAFFPYAWFIYSLHRPSQISILAEQVKAWETESHHLNQVQIQMNIFEFTFLDTTSHGSFFIWCPTD